MQLTYLDAAAILKVRLLVARVAQPDSLNWWDDRSLTPEGGYLVERLFARRSKLAAARIALAAAHSRHAAAIPDAAGFIHLFDLGDEIELELNTMPLDETWIPGKPHASSDDLVQAIRGVVPPGVTGTRGEPGMDGTLLVQLNLNSERSLHPAMREAGALALAYAAGGINRPVFPYLKRKD